MIKKSAGILVIKLGTRILTCSANRLDESRIRSIVAQVSGLVRAGYKIIIVSSGAIAAGMGVLGIKARPQSLPKLQACAAVGQTELMKFYSKLFKEERRAVAQVLLTQDDLNSRERYLNAKNTLFELLDEGVIPIINENDTVSTDEIKLGDNDRLSSLVAGTVEAKKLIIVTDVDCLYDKKKEPVRRVGRITKEIEDLAGPSSSPVGVGGMITKIQAAKIATESGVACHIVDGRSDDILLKAADDRSAGGGIGTLFEARTSCISAKKRWIAFTSKKKGSLMVDKGAKEVLINKNKSLLSSGILGAAGSFNAGDPVGICDEAGHEFARGLVNYNSKEVDKIKGLKTDRIRGALGYKYYDEVVHKDNLVIL